MAKGGAKKSLIGFLDVLGFSDLVKREDFGRYFSKYTSMIKASLKIRNRTKFNYTVFSDSVVILTNDTSAEALHDLAEAISELSFKALTDLNLPIKGCISVGMVTLNKNGKDLLIAGTPIVDAYQYEQRQNWIGVMISPNTLREFPRIMDFAEIGNINIKNRLDNLKSNFSWCSSIMRTTLIPLRNDNGEEGRFEGYAIVPHRHDAADAAHMLEDLKCYYAALKEQSLYSRSTEIQRKYNNTMMFIAAATDVWAQLWNNETYRSEFWENKSNAPNTIQLGPIDRNLPERPPLIDGTTATGDDVTKL